MELDSLDETVLSLAGKPLDDERVLRPRVFLDT